ncbi:MAG TPA: RDD family protein [Streptosporangiaceae bacterium]|jgi:uncharacterized RDD family membrane protein YckC
MTTQPPDPNTGQSDFPAENYSPQGPAAPGYGAPGYDAPGAQGYAAPPPPPQGYAAPPPQGYAPPPPGYAPMPPAPAGDYGFAQPGAAVPPGMYFDQLSGLTLPQGTELATVGRRIGAYFLAIPLAIVTLGIGYIIWGLIVWGKGQSPALQVLGMRVYRYQENRVATWGVMALREIVGRICESIFISIPGLIGFIMMLSNKERRCLHDMIATTVVLYDPNKVLDPPQMG